MRRRCLEESPWRSGRDGSSRRSTRRRWFGWSGTVARGAGALTTAERAELVALRREARQLRMEREILKKAAAFFVKESQ